MTRRGACSALLFAGCVGTPPATPQVAVAPVATGPAMPTATLAAEPTPATAPADPPASVVVAPEASATIVATTLPPGAIVGWPSDGNGHAMIAAVLFDDERAVLRAAVASALGKRGIPTLAMSQLEPVESAAASGVLVLEDDQRCATGLSRDEVRARYLVDRPLVHIEATCFDECRLNVRIEAPGQDDVYLASPAISRPELPSQWVAAAARLTDDMYGYGGLGLSGASHNPDVFFETPGSIGPWSKTPTSEDFDAIEPSVQSCGTLDAMLDLRYVVRAAIAPSGAVDRCAAEEATQMAGSRERQCLCDAVTQMRFARGKAHRRLRIDAVDRGSLAAVVPGVTVLQPGTRAWVDRIASSTALARCGSSIPMPQNLDTVLSMHVDRSGVVDDARIDGGITTVWDMRWAQCVVGEVEALRLPCAPPGIDRLRIRLRAGA